MLRRFAVPGGRQALLPLATLGALDAAIDRHVGDQRLPRFDGQVVTDQEELGNREKVHPFLPGPLHGVAPQGSRSLVARCASAVVRGHPRREDEPASALCPLGVQHRPDARHQFADLRHPLLGRAILEKRGKPLKVQLDAVAVIALDGFFDQPENVLPDRVVPEIQGTLTQAVFRMLAPECGTEEVVAMRVVDAESEQGLEPAVSCLGKPSR